MTDSEASTGIEMTISRKERMEKEKLDYENRIADPIIGAIGQIGPWQIWMCLIIFMMKFPVAWHQLATVYLAPPVEFECIKPINDTDKCSSECEEIKYDHSIFEETIITEWDLICDTKYLANLSQTIFMFGILVGNVLFGMVSDRIGRRPPLVFSVLMQLICGVAVSFSPWFWLFCVLRFLTAVATGGSMLTSFVLVMEIIGPKKREIMSILYQIPFNVGHLTLPLFSYYLRNWRWFQFSISIPSLAYISYYWLIPESPRWLLTTSNFDKSSMVLEKAAKCNNMSTENIRSDLEEYKKRKESCNTGNNNIKASLVDLIRYPNLRMKTIALLVNWFGCGISYFGVSVYIGGLSGDMFLNVAIAGFIGIPGALLAIPLTKYWGRKNTLMTSNALVGICMLIIAFAPESLNLNIVALAIIAVFGLTISFPNVYLYWGELLPTVLRNAGMGVASMVARIGAMVAPQVIDTKMNARWLPPFIFGIIPLIGALLLILVPETKGYPLPETVEDAENFGKKLPKNDKINK